MYKVLNISMLQGGPDILMSSILRSPIVDGEGFVSQYTAALVLLEEVGIL